MMLNFVMCAGHIKENNASKILHSPLKTKESWPKILTFDKYGVVYTVRICTLQYMKRSASESKPFQSQSKVKIPGWARLQEEQLSCSKLKQAFF